MEFKDISDIRKEDFDTYQAYNRERVKFKNREKARKENRKRWKETTDKIISLVDKGVPVDDIADIMIDTSPYILKLPSK